MNKQPEVLSQEIRKFISRTIDSIAGLEILLFFRDRRDKEWSVSKVATELRSSQEAVELQVVQLKKKGLLQQGTSDVFFQYGPSSSELEGNVEKLAELYPEYLARIIDCIYSAPENAMQEFMNAFKLKKEDEDG